MFKLFWQSTFTLFLTFLLIVNIAFAFNLAIFQNNPFLDLRDRYFGISSLIQLVSSRTFEDSFLGNFKMFLDSFYNWNIAHFNGQLYSQIDTSSIWDIFSLILNFLSYFILPITFIANILLLIVYYLMIAFWCVVNLMIFWSGSYSYQLPTYTYNVIHVTLMCV